MGEKKLWDQEELHLTIPIDKTEELGSRERRNLQRDIKYWKESSQRKDGDIKVLNNKIRGYKSHITRLQAALHKKGVYNV
jgi:predicted  nucleic acid-binding Zn-ribbon protein